MINIGDMVPPGDLPISDYQHVGILAHISNPLTRDAEVKHLVFSSSKSSNSVLTMQACNDDMSPQLDTRRGALMVG